MNSLKNNKEVSDVGALCIGSSTQEIKFENNYTHTNKIIMEGLCLNCEFIGFCVWKEDKKINCEHFE